jgi:hypothetical protein
MPDLHGAENRKLGYGKIRLGLKKKTKKISISEVLNTIKSNLRLYDTEYQKEIRTKMDSLNKRLTELNEGREDFYTSVINKPKVKI